MKKILKIPLRNENDELLDYAEEERGLKQKLRRKKICHWCSRVAQDVNDFWFTQNPINNSATSKKSLRKKKKISTTHPPPRHLNDRDNNPEEEQRGFQEQQKQDERKKMGKTKDQLLLLKNRPFNSLTQKGVSILKTSSIRGRPGRTRSPLSASVLTHRVTWVGLGRNRTTGKDLYEEQATDNSGEGEEAEVEVDVDQVNEKVCVVPTDHSNNVRTSMAGDAAEKIVQELFINDWYTSGLTSFLKDREFETKDWLQDPNRCFMTSEESWTLAKSNARLVKVILSIGHSIITLNQVSWDIVIPFIVYVIDSGCEFVGLIMTSSVLATKATTVMACHACQKVHRSVFYTSRAFGQYVSYTCQAVGHQAYLVFKAIAQYGSGMVVSSSNTVPRFLNIVFRTVARFGSRILDLSSYVFHEMRTFLTSFIMVVAMEFVVSLLYPNPTDTFNTGTTKVAQQPVPMKTIKIQSKPTEEMAVLTDHESRSDDESPSASIPGRDTDRRATASNQSSSNSYLSVSVVTEETYGQKGEVEKASVSKSQFDVEFMQFIDHGSISDDEFGSASITGENSCCTPSTSSISSSISSLTGSVASEVTFRSNSSRSTAFMTKGMYGLKGEVEKAGVSQSKSIVETVQMTDHESSSDDESASASVLEENYCCSRTTPSISQSISNLTGSVTPSHSSSNSGISVSVVTEDRYILNGGVEKVGVSESKSTIETVQLNDRSDDESASMNVTKEHSYCTPSTSSISSSISSLTGSVTSEMTFRPNSSLPASFATKGTYDLKGDAEETSLSQSKSSVETVQLTDDESSSDDESASASGLEENSCCSRTTPSISPPISSLTGSVSPSHSPSNSSLSVSVVIDDTCRSKGGVEKVGVSESKSIVETVQLSKPSSDDEFSMSVTEENSCCPPTASIFSSSMSSFAGSVTSEVTFGSIGEVEFKTRKLPNSPKPGYSQRQSAAKNRYRNMMTNPLVSKWNNIAAMSSEGFKGAPARSSTKVGRQHYHQLARESTS